MTFCVSLHSVTLERVLSCTGCCCWCGVGCSSLYSFVGHHACCKLLLRFLKTSTSCAVETMHLEGWKSSENMVLSLPFLGKLTAKSQTWSRAMWWGNQVCSCVWKDPKMSKRTFCPQKSYNFWLPCCMHNLTVGIPITFCKFRGSHRSFLKCHVVSTVWNDIYKYTNRLHP